ncbi:MAG: LUD domain-containing protein [Bacteroidetes bacterium]|nr:LUD domain-containing protein [Bacteroidota bacterium]
MRESSPREKILTSIRNALINKVAATEKGQATTRPVYHKIADDLSVTFAESLNNAGGKFYYCAGVSDFQKGLKGLAEQMEWEYIFCQDKSLQKLLKDAHIPYRFSETHQVEAKAGITRCEYLVARFGSVVVSSKTGSGRKAHIIPDSHIVLAFTSQIVMEIRDAMAGLQQKYRGALPSMVSFITGPSRTADIEKTLVMGAHGPRELFVFLIDT